MWKSLMRAWLESCVYCDPMAHTYWLYAKHDAEPEAWWREQHASYREDDSARHPHVVGSRTEAAG